jgi:FixJ family two-component response regulator
MAFTVFLVDDEPKVLAGLSRLLRAARFETAAFASPHEFLARHDRTVPGCAIVDLTMNEMDGLQLQELLLADGVHRPIIFLSGRGDIPSSVKAMKSGAIDFLVKPVDRARLLDAIERARSADERDRHDAEELTVIYARLSTLTPREREVMQFVIGGFLNKQIAYVLGTVEKTIKVHRGRMMEKMGVHSVADLVRLTEKANIQPARLAAC